MSELLLAADNPSAKYSATLDISKGSQLGLMADPSNWTSSAYLNRPHLIPVLLQAPKAFKYLDDAAGRVRRLKALFETKATAIGGLNATLTATYEEYQATKSGEFASVISRMERARSTPNFTWNEYIGMPIFKDMSVWMKEILEHPLTGAAGIISNQNYIDAGSPELLADDVSAIAMFIQPTHNLAGVDMVYMCADMKPNELPFESGMEFQGPRPPIEYSVDFTAITLHGDDVTAVMDLGLAYIESINKTGMTPAALQPFVEGISSDLLEDATGGVGIRGRVNAIAESI